jgi:hypothetical protein
VLLLMGLRNKPLVIRMPAVIIKMPAAAKVMAMTPGDRRDRNMLILSSYLQSVNQLTLALIVTNFRRTCCHARNSSVRFSNPNGCCCAPNYQGKTPRKNAQKVSTISLSTITLSITL